MAIRETRGSRKRLFLFLASIVMGVSALVAIQSFNHNLNRAIDEQARQLLGSDLVISARAAFSEDAEILIDTLGGVQARDYEFQSMALFTSTGATRLSRIRAIDEGWPFYGSIDAEPQSAVETLHNGRFALADRNLQIQFGLNVGDSIQVGNLHFEIAGFLIDVPGESAAAGIIGPRIFIPAEFVYDTGLLQRGSRADYRIHFQFDNPAPIIESLIAQRDELDTMRLSMETVADRQETFGQAFSTMAQFLGLVGFIALLLGGIGVASAVYAYIKQRVETVAVLHCLGADTSQTTAIYVVQMLMVGFLGALAGSILGIGIQTLIPILLQDFIPVDVSFSISPIAILIGLGVGMGTSVLFALLPLSGIRDISPMATLRKNDDAVALRFDAVRITIFGLIFLAVTLFAITQTERWFHGIFFSLGIFSAIGILVGIAKLITWGVRRYFPDGLSYVWRQGMANLYRPNNQTVMLMVTIGFATFLVATLYFSQSIILGQLDLTRQDNDANLIFYDIQTDQNLALQNKLLEAGAPVLLDVPIVTMRMTHINGNTVERIRQTKERTIPDWLFAQEVRATYRDTLTRGEKILSGEWIPESDFNADIVPISIAEGIAEVMNLSIGDTIRFNVQGIPLETYMASTREVNWQQVQPNFIFLFPAGVLEGAPQFHVVSTRAESASESVALQSSVVANFPNVSAIDLDVIIATVDDILGKITYVIQFMALFSVITGLIVLIGAVIASKFQRARESVLLKTLGASKRQVMIIQIAEYLFLGSFAALTGLLLAWLAAFLLSIFVFDTAFLFTLLPSIVLFVIVVALTMSIGLLNSRGLYEQPAVAVLREV